MDKVKILLVGIGGYGERYICSLLGNKVDVSVLHEIKDKFLRALLENSIEVDNAKIVGAVDPNADKCRFAPSLRDNGITIFKSLEEFYSNHTADLAIICTPIHLHLEHTTYCLSKGSNVLCEKPVCAVYQDAVKMLEAEKKYGKFVAIGYQLCYSDAIQELKNDIISGLFGKPIKLKAYVTAPRHEVYYKRSSWAGKIKTANGDWVLDSPIMNSNAHQLQNMFYVLGKTRETSAFPVSVKAELYRVNPLVENYDTVALRCFTEDNVEILMYATHATPISKINRAAPDWEYVFEKAVVYHDENNFDEECFARFNDGTIKKYKDYPKFNPFKKVADAVSAVITGEKLACGIETAMPHLLCINGAQQSMEIQNFPESMIETCEFFYQTCTYVNDIKDILFNCYNEGKLPYEMGYSFAKEAAEVNLKGYKEFNGTSIKT